MTTEDDIRAALAGECRASIAYSAFAEKAEREGHRRIARLFRAAAAAESVHARAQLRLLSEVNDTWQNLQTALDGEHREFKQMYPEFLRRAEAEGHKGAEVAFRYARDAEEVHHRLYGEALRALDGGGDFADGSIHICEVCGDIFVGEPPDECPICGASRKRFMEIE